MGDRVVTILYVLELPVPSRKAVFLIEVGRFSYRWADWFISLYTALGLYHVVGPTTDGINRTLKHLLEPRAMVVGVAESCVL